MEVLTLPKDNDRQLSDENDFLQISCNWKVNNNKDYREAISTVAAPKTFQKTNIEEVVSLETCVSLGQVPGDDTPCMLDIKVTNGQRISRIAVVSEACVLEFFKQSGEYEGTVFGDFVVEFDGNFAYFAETDIVPATTEASIRFTKTKNKEPSMWVYGIRLYLTEPVEQKPDLYTFDVDRIKSLLIKFNLTDDNILNGPLQPNRNVTTRHETNNEENPNKVSPCEATILKGIANYIDEKFQAMETRLMKRIDQMEDRTNDKLDGILKKLNGESDET